MRPRALRRGVGDIIQNGPLSAAKQPPFMPIRFSLQQVGTPTANFSIVQETMT